MLTPAFELKQDNDTLFITIKAPYTNIKDCDIYVFENEVKFYSKPYFLRLNLPGNVTENAKATTKYDADSGTFELILPKEVPGQHFEDLDLLTKLLAPKLKPGQHALIRDLDDVPDDVLDDEDGDIWQVEQVPFEERADILAGRMYGFNRTKTGVIGRMQDDLPGLCDIRDPEKKSVEDARIERLERETMDFDGDHYLADWFDEEGEIRSIMKLKMDFTEDFDLSESERALLSKLPVRTFVMSKEDKLRCVLGLVDLVFAWAYNNRVSDREWNSESGWTVAKLSATLSYLEEFSSMRSVMNSCMRRALIYPLYRNVDLAVLCWRDAIDVFRAGPKRVLKCLLDIHRALEKDADARYVLNELYITDYMIWLQRQCKRARLLEIADRMSQVEFSKDELCLDLHSLEQAAKMVELEHKMGKLDSGDRNAELEEAGGQSGTVQPSDTVETAGSARRSASLGEAAGVIGVALDSDDESGAASSTSDNDSDDY